MTAVIGITRRDADELDGAYCPQADPEMWFPHPNATIAYEEAATVCYSCPVKVECLAGARERGETWGVWGGVNFEKDPDADPFDPTVNEFCGTYAGAKRHRKRGQDVCDRCKSAAIAYDRGLRELRNARLGEAS